MLSIVFFSFWRVSIDVTARYENLLSTVIHDRSGVPISIAENSKGHYVNEVAGLPDTFATLLIRKEDRFFYYHFGINPVSSVRALFTYLTKGDAGGSSTITQQLAKNILGTEIDRTIQNKLLEVFYTLAIESFFTKTEILQMYANSVFLGNQVQGFGTASYAYFETSLPETTINQQLALLATLAYPSTRNPWESDNVLYAEGLHRRLIPERTFTAAAVTNQYAFQKDSFFELTTAGVTCQQSCTTTIDDSLTANIREILDRHIQKGWSRNIRHGAVVVIDAHSTELLAIVGSSNPQSTAEGDQINMALQPRPIGSTVKPLIYAKGFMEGLRPYTLVEDREYKYPIATGFPLYPKNYDGQYRGEVTLHEALSNSLNVPSVKVLEYVGLEQFYSFLGESLRFQPIQPYETYQYGIALGGLEMDLLTLTHYFTLFPARGYLSPLQLLAERSENFSLPPQSNITVPTKIADEAYVSLVHTIISDRFTGVNQFGLEGNLNLTTTGYGVKTGTSRDFHDSWVVGYTADFVVGVWMGNSKNEPLLQVSGSSGAGGVWHDVMEYLLNTPYTSNVQLTSSQIERVSIGVSDEWAIVGDNIFEHQTLLQDTNLILSIHSGDTFELQPNMTIPLRARAESIWSINGTFLDTAKNTTFSPTESGTYEVMADNQNSDQREIIVITVTTQEGQ